MDYDNNNNNNDDDDCEYDENGDIKITPEYKARLEAKCALIVQNLERDKRQIQPLKGLMEEARDIVAAYDHKNLLLSKLDDVNQCGDIHYSNELIARMADTAHDVVTDISIELDARLVKQARTMDAIQDLLIHISQYSLCQDTESLKTHLNLALRAQDQSARTIEKFKKLALMRNSRS